MSDSRPPLGPSLPGQRPALHPNLPQGQPAPVGPPKIAGVPIQPVRRDEVDMEPISLVDEPENAASTPSKIKAFGVGGSHTAHKYKRQPVATGQGAVRVRSFHGRLSDEGMAYMDDKINEWLDEHPEIEVKLVTTTIGQFEGKIREPALVVNVWF